MATSPSSAAAVLRAAWAVGPLVALLAATGGAAAQDPVGSAPPVVEWDVAVPTDGPAVGNAVIRYAGGAAVAGYVTTPAGHVDALLARLDGDGAVAWVRRYGGADDDYLWDVRTTPDGGLFAVGFTGPGGAEDIWTLHVDSAGELLRERRYGGPGRERAWALSPDGAGGWYVAAERAAASEEEQDAFVLRLDPAGDTVWTAILGGDDVQRAYSVAAVPGGGAVVTGGTGGNDRRAGDNDVLVARYGGSGELRWSRSFGGSRYDVGHGVRVEGDPGEGDLRILVTGYGTPDSNPNGDTDVMLFLVDGDGEVIWSRVHPGSGHERAMMSEAATGGGWIIVGFATVDGEFDLRLARADRDGREESRWLPHAPGTDRGVMVHALPDGSYLVTGAFADRAGLRVIKLRMP